MSEKTTFKDFEKTSQTPEQIQVEQDIARLRLDRWNGKSIDENELQGLKDQQDYFNNRAPEGSYNEFIDVKEKNPLEDGLFPGDVFYKKITKKTRVVGEFTDKDGNAIKDQNGNTLTHKKTTFKEGSQHVRVPEYTEETVSETVYAITGRREVGGEVIVYLKTETKNGDVEEMLTEDEARRILQGAELVDSGEARENAYFNTQPGVHENAPKEVAKTDPAEQEAIDKKQQAAEATEKKITELRALSIDDIKKLCAEVYGNEFVDKIDQEYVSNMSDAELLMLSERSEYNRTQKADVEKYEKLVAEHFKQDVANRKQEVENKRILEEARLDSVVEKALDFFRNASKEQFKQLVKLAYGYDEFNGVTQNGEKVEKSDQREINLRKLRKVSDDEALAIVFDAVEHGYIINGVTEEDVVVIRTAPKVIETAGTTEISPEESWLRDVQDGSISPESDTNNKLDSKTLEALYQNPIDRRNEDLYQIYTAANNDERKKMFLAAFGDKTDEKLAEYEKQYRNISELPKDEIVKIAKAAFDDGNYRMPEQKAESESSNSLADAYDEIAQDPKELKKVLRKTYGMLWRRKISVKNALEFDDESKIRVLEAAIEKGYELKQVADTENADIDGDETPTEAIGMGIDPNYQPHAKSVENKAPLPGSFGEQETQVINLAAEKSKRERVIEMGKKSVAATVAAVALFNGQTAPNAKAAQLEVKQQTSQEAAKPTEKPAEQKAPEALRDMTVQDNWGIYDVLNTNGLEWEKMTNEKLQRLYNEHSDELYEVRDASGTVTDVRISKPGRMSDELAADILKAVSE